MVLNAVWAQTNSADPGESANEAALHIHVVDDPGPVQTQTMSAKGYVVQVTNAAGAPVSAAAVALRLPEEGPTGRFTNGLRAWVAYSDAAGIARFPVIQWGDNSGPLELRLTAAKGTSHNGLMIALQIGSDHPSMSIVSVPIEAATLVPKPAGLAPEIIVETPQPGTTSMPLADIAPPDISPIDLAKSGASAPAKNPHSLTPNPPPTSDTAESAVSITNAATGANASYGSHKLLWILPAAETAAGAGTMFALQAHGGDGSPGSSSGVSVGSPTITVGH
jgi:hypothetical protein